MAPVSFSAPQWDAIAGKYDTHFALQFEMAKRNQMISNIFQFLSLTQMLKTNVCDNHIMLLLPLSASVVVYQYNFKIENRRRKKHGKGDISHGENLIEKQMK